MLHGTNSKKNMKKERRSAEFRFFPKTNSVEKWLSIELTLPYEKIVYDCLHAIQCVMCSSCLCPCTLAGRASLCNMMQQRLHFIH